MSSRRPMSAGSGARRAAMCGSSRTLDSVLVTAGLEVGAGGTRESAPGTLDSSRARQVFPLMFGRRPETLTIELPFSWRLEGPDLQAVNEHSRRCGEHVRHRL